MPAEELRRAVQDEVGAVLERPQEDGRGRGRVDERRGPGVPPPLRGRGTSSNGFDGASSQTRSAPSGGGPVWSNSTNRSPQRSSSRSSTPVPKYAPRGNRDRRARLEQAEHDRRRRRRRPTRRAARGRPRARRAPPRRRRPSGARRGVDERARLAVLVRPDRRAVERSGSTATLLRDAWPRPRQPGADDDTTRSEARAARGAPRRGAARREREGGRAPARARASCSRASGSRSCSTRARSSSSTATSATASPTSGCSSNRPYGDAVVTGYGTIFGRKVFVFSQDFTVFGGSLSRGLRREDLQGHGPGREVRLPGRSGSTTPAARASRRASSRSPATRRSSGATSRPRASSRRSAWSWGPCAGGAVYSPAITDFVFMVEGTSYMFITGPDVVKTVTGEEVTFEELGGAATHASQVGRRALHLARRGGVPRGRALPALVPAAEQPRAAAVLRADRPARPRGRRSSTRSSRTTPNKPYDIKQVIAAVVDDGDFLEVHERYAENIVCGFARLGGHVGRRRRRTSRRRSPACSTSTRRSRPRASSAPATRSTSRSSPSSTCPGFLPGTAQEWGGIISHGAKLLYAYCEATVPKLTVITRKAYGGAYDVMSSKHIRADFNFAWPTAEVAVMGPEGAVNIVFRQASSRRRTTREARRGRADRGLPRALREPVRRRRARLRRRRHRAAADAAGADRRARDRRSRSASGARRASTGTSRSSAQYRFPIRRTLPGAQWGGPERRQRCCSLRTCSCS